MRDEDNDMVTLSLNDSVARSVAMLAPAVAPNHFAVMAALR